MNQHGRLDNLASPDLSSHTAPPPVNLGIVMPTLSRSAGGLFWAVSAMAQALRAHRCDVKVFGALDGHTQEDSEAWMGMPVGVHRVRGPAFFGYQPGLLKDIKVSRRTIIHTHGLWTYNSVAALRWSALTKAPYVVSPHGMLDPWAVKNSAWKKTLARIAYEKAHLNSSACIHALCEQEYESIRKFGLRGPVAVVPNGIHVPDRSAKLGIPDWRSTLPAESNILLFLGRIHPKKGIERLLRAWAAVPKQERLQWHFVVAGWNQGDHENELRRSVHGLRIDESVHFVGPQFSREKSKTLSTADAFVLPSLSEGLPMAVLEAWSFGLPVLITPECNLPIGYEKEAAIKGDPTLEGLTSALRELFRLSPEKRVAMGRNGLQLVRSEYQWVSVAEKMSQVYEWVLGSRERPAFVRVD